MKRSSLIFVFCIGILAALPDSALAQSSISIPWTNTFESYPLGYSITDDTSWRGVSTSAASIVSIPDHGLKSGYETNAAHTQALQIEEAVTNFFIMQSNVFVYVDMLVKMPYTNEASVALLHSSSSWLTPPTIAGFFVNEQGELVFSHSTYEGESNYLQTLSTNSEIAIAENEWHRLTVSIEFKPALEYYDIYFTVQFDGGTPYSNQLGYADTATNYFPDGGAWFMAEALPSYGMGFFHGISFSPGITADDIVVSTNPPGPLPPTVIRGRGGAINEHFYSADLQAVLIHQSIPTSEIWLYWGTNDVGATTSGWDNARYVGTNAAPAPVDFSQSVNGLNPGSDYHYRYRAGTEDQWSWTEPVAFHTIGPATIPVLSNAPMGWVDTEWASINGVMVSGVRADIRLYIGIADGGTNAGAWDRIMAGSDMPNGNLPAAFDVDPGVTYYYRYYAANSAGSAWAPESGTFTAPLVSSNVVYVDREAGGLNNGSSWPHAFVNVQDGLNAAGDGFSVVVRNGHYLLDAGLVISNALTLHGEFEEPVSTVNGDDQFRCIEVLNSNASIDTMVIRNGYAKYGGAAVHATNGCTIRNSMLTLNNGGAVYFMNGGLLENCQILNNQSIGTGAAVSMWQGGHIEDCLIQNNESGDGAPVYLYSNGVCRGSEILSNRGVDSSGVYMRYSGHIVDTLCAYNSGGRDGGGAMLRSESIASNCTVIGNSAVEGGGLYLRDGSEAYDCTFISNSASSVGGGLFIHSGSRAISCTSYSNTAAFDGGGILCEVGTYASNCVSKWNMAGQRGGGMFLDNATAVDCIAENNQSDIEGGGIYCEDSSILRSTFAAGNSATTLGGGIYCENSVVSDSTVSGNSTVGQWGRGGGISSHKSTVTDCTVVSNYASYAADGVYASDESVLSDCLIASNVTHGLVLAESMIDNCLITRNAVGVWTDYGTIRNCTIANNDRYSEITNNIGLLCNGGSLIINSIIYSNDTRPGGVNMYSRPFAIDVITNSCITPNPGDASNVTVPPMFVNAAANDFRLQPGSPCIDAGAAITNLTTDYAGLPRPNDGDDDGTPEWDIGAFEYPHMFPQGGVDIMHRRPVFTWPDTGKQWTQLFINRNGTNYTSAWVENDNTWTAESDFHGGNYKWWVRTWEDGVGYSPWSGTAHFVIPFWPPAKPIQLWPAGNIPQGNIPYAWIGDTNATRYEIYIRRNGTGNWTQWYDTGSVSGRVIQVIPGHTANTLYEWWIRSQNRDGESEWSEGMWFSTPDPFPATTHYVTTNGTAIWPYTNWIQAATDIQTAINTTLPGDTVLVTNDVYDSGSQTVAGNASDSRIVVSNNILVRSVNGPQETVICASNEPNVRCAYLADGILAGFTLLGGTVSNAPYFEDGGCVYAVNGTVSNCVISGGAAARGGGIIGGTARNCRIVENVASNGSGAYVTTLYDSIICSNGPSGLVGCTATACTICHNYGGAYACVLDRCLIASNHWGGLRDCTARNSVIISNVSQTAAGASGGRLENCLVAWNVSPKFGPGGVSDALVIGCTIAFNKTEDQGAGGVSGCVVSNSIVYYNSGALGNPNPDFEWTWPHNYWSQGGTSNFSYSCTFPHPGGIGNSDVPPRFMDMSNSNFRLKYGSPCIDMAWPIPALNPDLDGRSRPLDGDGVSAPAYDMGCYEYDYANDDSDGDTLTDKTEVEMAGMDPLDDDDDDDGIPTAIEVDWNSIPGYQAGSDLNPASWDSDNDNVCDIIEVATGNSALDDQSAGSITISAPLTFDSKGRTLLEWPIFDTYRSFDISYYVERTTNMQDWLPVGGYIADGDTTRDLRFTDRFGSPEFACYRLRLSMFQDPNPLPITLTVTNELSAIGIDGNLLYNGVLTNGAVVPGSVAITGTGSPFPLIDDGDGTLTGQLGTDGTIAYDTGAWAIDLKTLAAEEGTPIHISYQYRIYQGPIPPPPEVVKGESIGVGDISHDRCAGVLSNRNVVGSSLGITAGGYSFMDNGSGILLGTISGTTGSISYDTGAWSIHLLSGLSDGTSLTASYSYIFENPTASLACGELLGMGNGTFTMYSGALATNTIETGTVVIVAGSLLFEDQGDGTLDGTDTMTGTIDYSTGDWLIDLQTTPLGTDEAIRAWYDYR